jgi:TRAP-type C4-dicarboxylate transport system permease large subunit
MWELVKPTLGFIAIMIAVLLIITYVPGLILYLPYALGN